MISKEFNHSLFEINNFTMLFNKASGTKLLFFLLLFLFAYDVTASKVISKLAFLLARPLMQFFVRIYKSDIGISLIFG